MRKQFFIQRLVGEEAGKLLELQKHLDTRAKYMFILPEGAKAI
jgi:hypothetical protein